MATFQNTSTSIRDCKIRTNLAILEGLSLRQYGLPNDNTRDVKLVLIGV